MLNAMRKQAGSWVVKIFLGLLVASFAVWGIGDIFRIQPDTPVIQVGEIDVSQEAFSQAYNRELRQMQQQFGGNLTSEMARQLGLVDRTVGGLVDRALYDSAAASLDLTASDATVRKMIQENPSFQNSLGEFDRFTYENIIRQAGFTEDRFVRLSRRDSAREQLINSFSAGISAPKGLVDNLVLHQQQRRRFSRVKWENSDLVTVPEPTEEQLVQFHKDNEDLFKSPEYRKIRYVVVEPEDLFEEIDISETAIEESYQNRLDEFTIIETRVLDQFVLTDEKEAVAAKDRLNAGDDFYVVAKDAADMDESDANLGELRKSELPQEIRDIIFGLNEGDISKPIQSGFGWHIVRVNKINPGRVAPLEETKGRIVADLKRERALDLIYELSQDIEDSFAGGASLGEVAQSFELTVQSIAAVDRNGKDLSEAEIADLPQISGFLGTVFSTNVDTDLALKESETGAYYAVDVEEIIEVQVKPLESVRDAVAEAWTDDKRRELAIERRAALLEEAKSGTPMKELAETDSGEFAETEALPRGELFREENLDNEFVKQLYAASPGDILAGTARNGDAQVIFRLEEVSPANLSSETEFRTRIDEVVGQSLSEDFFAVFNLALQKEYEPTVNEQLLQQLFDSGGQG